MSFFVNVLYVAAVLVLFFLYLRMMLVRKENPNSTPAPKADSEVLDSVISWLAKRRGVSVEVLNRGTLITEGEIEAGKGMAMHYYRMTLVVKNIGNIKTVGQFADLIESQLDW
ncbi:MAG: hypothetical protein AAB467_01285 [Patescibacteria group bacterium]